MRHAAQLSLPQHLRILGSGFCKLNTEGAQGTEQQGWGDIGSNAGVVECAAVGGERVQVEWLR